MSIINIDDRKEEIVNQLGQIHSILTHVFQVTDYNNILEEYEADSITEIDNAVIKNDLINEICDHINIQDLCCIVQELNEVSYEVFKEEADEEEEDDDVIYSFR